MEILLVNLGNMCECFVSTCILKGLKKVYFDKDPVIDVLVSDDTTKTIFKYNRNIRNIYTGLSLSSLDMEKYDLVINASKTGSERIDNNNLIGFMTPDGDQFFDVIYGEKVVDKNIFQVYFNLAGMKWHGESYDFCYNPKTRNKKNRTGVYLSNLNLKRYILNKLKLEEGEVWNIPFKTNILRKLDEINKCNNVITDDYLTMHLAVYLRKYVYFLLTIPQTTNIELFGKGRTFDIPIPFLK